MSITQEEVNAFMAKFRKRGERTISLLGKNQDFVNAYHTKIGEQILGYLVAKHEELLDKIAEFNATEEDKATYKVVRSMLIDISTKIEAYYSAMREIKEGKEK